MSLLDLRVFQFFNSLTRQSVFLDFVGVFFAEYFPYLVLILTLILLSLLKNWRVRFYSFAFVALSVILARGILVSFFDMMYFRPRPFEALSFDPLIAPLTTSSFPSGHTAVFFALATAFFLIRRSWGIFFYVFATLIGVGRIFVGVHWPSDVFAGAAVGMASALFVNWLLRKTDSPMLAQKKEEVALPF